MKDHNTWLALIILSAVISMGIENLSATKGGPNGSEAVLGKEIKISVQPVSEEEDPSGAWGDRRYLIAWQSTRNGPSRIYGTQLSNAGEIVPFNGTPDGFPVSFSPADQLFPSVAWTNHLFLVVWQDLRSKKNWEIYGGRVDSTGHRLDPTDLPIGTGSSNRRHPVVTGNGDFFLVVWMEERQATGWDIVGRRISSDGKPLDPVELLISGLKGDQTSPSLTWDGRNFFVVWMDGRHDQSPAVYGARIDPRGKLLDPDGILISSGAADQAYPAVAFDGVHNVVVWADRRNGENYLLYGARIDLEGAVLDPKGIPLSVTPHLHMFPDISCRRYDCLVVWEEEIGPKKKISNIQDIVRDVNGLRWKTLEKDLTAASQSALISISSLALGNHFSRVATDGKRYLVVWKDYRFQLAGGFARLIDFSENSNP